MNLFFAHLRMMLSADLERLNLGAVVHQFIREEILPRLQKKLAVATTDNDKARLGKLIEDYEKYSDPRTPESKIYSKLAAMVVKRRTAQSKMNDQDQEDLTQNLAVDFFQPLTGGHALLSDTLRRVREDEGPYALSKLWMSAVDKRTKYHIRQIQRHNQEKTVLINEDDEGNESNPMDNLHSQDSVEERTVKEVMDALTEYMHKKLHNPKFVAMFDVWFDAVKNGNHNIDMKKDVYQPLLDKGFPGTYSTMMEQWRNPIAPLVMNFMTKELGTGVTQQVKNILHLSSADAIAYSLFRQRMAAWVLGGVIRAMVDAEQ